MFTPLEVYKHSAFVARHPYPHAPCPKSTHPEAAFDVGAILRYSTNDAIHTLGSTLPAAFSPYQTYLHETSYIHMQAWSDALALVVSVFSVCSMRSSPRLLVLRHALPSQVVDEARRRLLERHGAAVEGYLPKGALKSKDELDYVRELSRTRTDVHGADVDAVGRYLSAPLPGDGDMNNQ